MIESGYYEPDNRQLRFEHIVILNNHISQLQFLPSNGLVVSFGNQSGNLLSGGLQASRVQVVVESEFLNLLEEGLFKSGLGSVIVVSPFTVTRPSKIIFSQARRLAIPACAKNACKRSSALKGFSFCEARKFEFNEFRNSREFEFLSAKFFEFDFPEKSLSRKFEPLGFLFVEARQIRD